MNCLTIFLSTVDLALQGNISTTDEDVIFQFCSLYNAFEIIMKIIGFGVQRVFRDKVLSIDILSFAYFLIKSLMSYMKQDSSNLRFFKTVVLLRNIRLFYLFSYMHIVLYVIRRTSYSIINLALILFVFLFTFALFGLQTFGSQMTSLSGTRYIYFNNLGQSFFSVFDLMTFDNWYTLLIDGVNNGFLYSMSGFIFLTIILGSFILLNLFMAIVLEGFEYASAFYDMNKENNKIMPHSIKIQNLSLRKSPRNCSPSRRLDSSKKSVHFSPRFSSFGSQIYRMGLRKHAWINISEDKSLG